MSHILPEWLACQTTWAEMVTVDAARAPVPRSLDAILFDLQYDFAARLRTIVSAAQERLFVAHVKARVSISKALK